MPCVHLLMDQSYFGITGETFTKLGEALMLWVMTLFLNTTPKSLKSLPFSENQLFLIP